MSLPRSETGAVILNIVYGYNAERIESDPLIDMAGDAMDKFAKAAVPGAFMVDILPFCMYGFTLQPLQLALSLRHLQYEIYLAGCQVQVLSSSPFNGVLS